MNVLAVISPGLKVLFERVGKPEVINRPEFLLFGRTGAVIACNHVGWADSLWSLRRALSPDFSAGALALFIPWRVGAEESGAAKEAFGGALSARPARAAWAAQRLLAARW